MLNFTTGKWCHMKTFENRYAGPSRSLTLENARTRSRNWLDGIFVYIYIYISLYIYVYRYTHILIVELLSGPNLAILHVIIWAKLIDMLKRVRVSLKASKLGFQQGFVRQIVDRSEAKGYSLGQLGHVYRAHIWP